MVRLSGILGVCALAAAALCAAAQDAGWEWPLELPRRLSGSFGEDRGGRNHMGLDLRTGGVTGKAVHAAGDGEIVRVRCSAWGYGRALYLRLDSGHTVVYGHLSEYGDPLGAYVRAAQHARRRYDVDLTPGPGAFRVARGQVIGRSGDSGSGPAHLHFEVRDAAGRPVNPRTLGYAWEDTTPPVPGRLLVCPAGPDDRVNGAPAPAVFPLERDAAGRYVCPPVRVLGTVGLGVECVDPEPDGPRLGAHTYRLSVSGTERYAVRYDRLSYDTNSHNAVCYHPYLGDVGRFLLLWRWPGNRSGCVEDASGDGWLPPPETAMEAVVEVADFMGNRAEIAVSLLPAGPGEAPAPAHPQNRAQGRITARSLGAWLSLEARFPAAEGEAPVLETDGPEGPHTVPFVRTGPGGFCAGWAPGTDGACRLRAVHPRLDPLELSPRRCSGGGALTLEGAGGMRLALPAGSVFGPTLLWAADGGFAPAGAPFARPARLTLPVPEGLTDPSRAGIVRVAAKGGEWVGGKPAAGGLEAEVDAPGAFRVEEDASAPQLRDWAPEEGGVCQGRRPRIVATVSDTGSGVAAWSLDCGGQWLLCAYDGDDGRIVWERDEDLPAGAQTLTLRVADGAGNAAEFTRRLLVGGR